MLTFIRRILATLSYHFRVNRLAALLLLTLLTLSTVRVGESKGVQTTSEHLATANSSVVGGWSLTGSMNQARMSHTATLLPGGKVLIAGGSGNGSSTKINSAELYNPVSCTHLTLPTT